MNKWILFLVLLFASKFLQAGPHDKWIVVTTIQYPTVQLKKLAQIPGWHLVVVGDKKTPKDWHLDNCDYLSPEKQMELGYELASLLPWNHYCRKNIGYLYAIEHGAKIIYDTDDDNEPLNGLNPSSQECTLTALTTDERFLNIYSYFGQPDVWPRGFPLDKIQAKDTYRVSSKKACRIGIEQGVVNGSPDVDAIFRLTQDRVIEFAHQPTCFLPENVFCPFNSQNTFFHPSAFFTLYVPAHVSMRVADIWRGYVAQKLIWKEGAIVAFSGPNAIQDRNFHSLMHDFILEQSLYLDVTKLINILYKWQCPTNDPYQNLNRLYEALIHESFFEERELPLVKAWLNDIKRVRCSKN